MNIEEVKRINNLTKELLAHGIAETSEQATLKAEEIVSRQTPEEKVKEPAIQQTNQDTMYVENIVKHLSSNVREMASTINRLQQDHALLKAQVDELKKLGEEKPAVKAENNVEPALKENNYQKTGFSAEDIAIDKIFYFGKK